MGSGRLPGSREEFTVRPPICDVCGARAGETDDFALVAFADHEPLPDGMVGHPRGLHWLCPVHVGYADLTDLTLAQARAAAAGPAASPDPWQQEWPDGDGTSGVQVADGELLWWSRPGGPNGRFGEAARTQTLDDYRANGPAVTCPTSVESTLDRLLGRR